jgi:hypothetical protein
MTLTPKEIQEKIITLIKANPGQTRADVADKLRCPADLHRIAMNMNELARRGILAFERRGWDNDSCTKRYSLVR